MNGIKSIREATGITQKEMADILNVSQSAVAKWETGESRPSAGKLPRIAKLLGCTIDELFKADDPTN